jgi:hypothetical protein
MRLAASSALVAVKRIAVNPLYLSINLWLYSPCGPWPLLIVLIYTQSVGLLGRGLARRKVATYTQNTNTK